ncbi:hypothetical protein [Dictyobacter formicarum]|uniref:Uncharacterized protein n=1 Tax=Dictyobacter formicarum TaxID=2778368 RepID=A0ABQ3VIM2_9CHLR|nr:hypothetical protein [Dictyobacter formicarum]GHO85635.1 hypothetical protein KSZ_36410 [Dictyobacter formicarum]
MARDQKVKNKATKKPIAEVQQTPVETAAPAEPATAPSAAPLQVVEQDNRNTVAAVQPSWPSWPTSKPGPRSTPPPPGMRSFNPFRPEQVSEIGYNQATGEPGSNSPLRSLPDPSMGDLVSFDQKPTGQDILGKRKKRL